MQQRGTTSSMSMVINQPFDALSLSLSLTSLCALSAPQFWNCADVRIVGGSGGSAPATTPTLVPAKPASKPAPKGWWELPAPKLCSTRPNAPICICKVGVHPCRPARSLHTHTLLLTQVSAPP